jgi:hypothetical protein
VCFFSRLFSKFKVPKTSGKLFLLVFLFFVIQIWSP